MLFLLISRHPNAISVTHVICDITISSYITVRGIRILFFSSNTLTSNERHCVSNHRLLDGLLKIDFKLTTNYISVFRIPITGGFFVCACVCVGRGLGERASGVCVCVCVCGGGGGGGVGGGVIIISMSPYSSLRSQIKTATRSQETLRSSYQAKLHDWYREHLHNVFFLVYSMSVSSKYLNQ